MHRHPDVISSLHTELYDWRLWTTRVVVLAFAGLAGLTVVAFTLVSDLALKSFHFMNTAAWWSPLVFTPLCTAAIVWCTQKYAPGAAGHWKEPSEDGDQDGCSADTLYEIACRRRFFESLQTVASSKPRDSRRRSKSAAAK